MASLCPNELTLFLLWSRIIRWNKTNCKQSQLHAPLHCNVVSHWLDTDTKWSLNWTTTKQNTTKPHGYYLWDMLYVLSGELCESGIRFICSLHVWPFFWYYPISASDTVMDETIINPNVILQCYRIIGSGNGLSRCQSQPMLTYWQFYPHKFASMKSSWSANIYKKKHLKMSSAKWWSFGSHLNKLIQWNVSSARGEFSLNWVLQCYR